MKCTIFKPLLLLIIPGIIFSRNITANSMNKLSPDLQALVAEKNPENAHLTDNRFPQISTVKNAERETLYPITIRSTDIAQVKAAGIKTNTDHENWSTARVNYDQLLELAELEVVTDVFQGDMLYAYSDLAVGLSGADLVHDAYLNDIAYDGTDVIVLIIDSGIDWSHLDFRDPSDDTKSRILYIWDQTQSTGSSTPQDRDGTNFSGLDYGVEYTQTQIENEIDGSPAGVVLAEDSTGHGTEVAGGAVGNGASLSSTKYKGMAPDADIVIVRAGRANTFTDSNVKDALTYAEKISATTGKPVVANLSLGGQDNAHDGTSTLEEAVDSFTSSGNGRVAVVAAGNEGNESIHVTGTVAASATEDITITVPSFSANSGSSNDYFKFELWWNNNADVTAKVLSPSSTYSYTRTADQTGTSSTAHGTIALYNVTDSDHSNGDRRTWVQVYDYTEDVGPEAGDWTLQVTNNSGSTMTYHAWLYSSSMSATVSGGDTTYTVGSPGSASSAITVGAYTARWRWNSTAGGALFSGTDLSDDIAYFSSIGPTRDGSQKPDICVPGRGQISTTSTDYTPSSAKEIVEDKYHLTEGTSGASGMISGAVALLLDYNTSMTAAQAKSFITGNANSDDFTGSVPNYEWGYGKLNIFESVAKGINNSATVDHDIYTYDTWGTHTGVSLGTNVKTSVRFSPSTSGDVTGAFFHMGSLTGTSGNVSFEIWSNSSGQPNAKLGSTVTISVDDISKSSWSYVPLKATGVSVTSGTDYHLVCLNTASANISIYHDGSASGRSYVNTGSWALYYDWRMRIIVSTDETTLDSSLPVELAFFNASTSKGQVQLKWATESEIENQGFRLDRRVSPAGGWEFLADHTTNPELEGQGSSSSRSEYSYADDSAKPGVRYDYRLSDIPYSAVYKANTIILEDIQLFIERFELFANYPNPFNPSTRIAYQIAKPSEVIIMVTDIKGREIRSWDLKSQETGYYETLWDGLDSNGKVAAAGVYFSVVQAGSEQRSQKMLLIK